MSTRIPPICWRSAMRCLLVFLLLPSQCRRVSLDELLLSSRLDVALRAITPVGVQLEVQPVLIPVVRVTQCRSPRMFLLIVLSLDMRSGLYHNNNRDNAKFLPPPRQSRMATQNHTMSDFEKRVSNDRAGNGLGWLALSLRGPLTGWLLTLDQLPTNVPIATDTSRPSRS